MFSHYLLFDIARSSQINAHIGVDPNTQCIARRFVGCITEPFQEEQVLLSSLLPAYHTHTRDPYSQAISRDDGYRHYNDVVIHLTFEAALLCSLYHQTLLRQVKLMAG